MADVYVCSRCGVHRPVRYSMGVHMVASHTNDVSKFIASHIEDLIDFVDYVEVQDA